MVERNIKQDQLLITGANGQLGKALQVQYPNARFADIKELDITNAKAVERYNWSGLKVIINAAAYTNVDQAETLTGRQDAWRVNAVAVANLTKIAQQKHLTLVHISTDYVFDGTVKGSHTEDESFTPLSVYGASKAAGDLLVSTLPHHYILRTSWVIGEGSNFVKTMLGLAQRDISPSVVNDQVGRLTFTNELTRAINHLLTTHAPYGTYNVTNSGILASWAQITREIFQNANKPELEVKNTTTAAYFKGKDNIAPRPLNSDMSLEKLHKTGFESRDWQEELKKYVDKELKKEKK